VHEITIPNLNPDTHLPPDKDAVGEVRVDELELHCSNILKQRVGNTESVTRPRTLAQESLINAKLLKHMEPKCAELWRLIQAESGARSEVVMVVSGLTQKVVQMSAYQDILLKTVEQQADKLADLHVRFDEVCSGWNAFQNSFVTQSEDHKAHLVEINERNIRHVASCVNMSARIPRHILWRCIKSCPNTFC